MPKIEEKQPTIEELTTEQKQSVDQDYIDAVNQGVAEGLAEIEAGQGVPAEQVWRELGLED